MLAASGFRRTLTEAAPGLSRRFFTCTTSRSSCGPRSRAQINHNRHASDLTAHASGLQSGRYITRQSPLKEARSPKSFPRNAANTLRSKACPQSQWTRAFSGSTRRRADAAVTGPVGEAAESGNAGGSSFPRTSSNAVAYWLLGSAASVFGIVVFGGLTRLTESGLSITEWKPVTGSLPPRSHEDWEAEFAKYRSSPEFKILNSRMTLEEFKNIYWMEWIHRLWGRFVGLSFVLPAVYFVARKKVAKPMAWRLFGIAGLIGFQGFIGWWMVKSGLKDDLFAPGSHPRVSQYRLTAHLGAAFVCYVAMLWNGLDILRTNKLVSQPAQTSSSILNQLRNPSLRSFKVSVAALAGLVFFTAMSGGLVAGLDAGLIYNEFPYMGLGLTPPKSELFDKFYSHREDHSDLVWRNFLENPSLVQLDHRILATTTFSAVMALWAWTKFSQQLKKNLPRAALKGVHGVVGFVFLQVTLGITTLLYLVPTGLASAHQAGSLALLTWTLVLGSRVWMPSAMAQKIVAERVRTAVSTGSRTQSQGASSRLSHDAQTAASLSSASTQESVHRAGSLAASGVGLLPLGLFSLRLGEPSHDEVSSKVQEMKREYLQRQAGKGDGRV